MTGRKWRILAIVVTYYPIANVLIDLLRMLLPQVNTLFIVDNSDARDDEVFHALLVSGLSFDDIRFIRLGENKGIATALNIGLDLGIDENFDFVLLSDQDSLPANDMVENLRKAYVALDAQGTPVGAIGPTFTDLHTRMTYPFQAQLPGKFFYGHKAPTAEYPHVEALTLITSGTLIPMDVIREVGPMREDFFIDHVDIEWCHRTRALGYRLFGTGWAAMYQRMGEARLRVWYLRWRYESAYSPLRIYYRLRNFVALWKTDFIDFRWKVRNTWFSLGIVYAHTFFSKRQNLKYLLFAIKGVWHGLTNRMGPYKAR